MVIHLGVPKWSELLVEFFGGEESMACMDVLQNQHLRPSIFGHASDSHGFPWCKKLIPRNAGWGAFWNEWNLIIFNSMWVWKFPRLPVLYGPFQKARIDLQIGYDDDSVRWPHVVTSQWRRRFFRGCTGCSAPFSRLGCEQYPPETVGTGLCAQRRTCKKEIYCK
jgi:hypothetical protein